MLAFSPLASAPLGADAARLPQILAQAASGMALEGVGAARARISARKQSGTAADLPLGGHAQASAKVRGQGLVGLPFGGDAQAQSAIGSDLQSDFPVAGTGGAQARTDADVSDTIDLPTAARSVVGVEGSGVASLDFSRRAEAGSQVDVAAARSLPLMGSSMARLATEGAAATALSFDIAIKGSVRVALQGLGDFAFGGLALSECQSNGALVASLTTAGAGVLANPTAGLGAGGFAIVAHAKVAVPAGAGAEATVSVAGTGSSDVSADGAGAIVFSFGLRANGRAALGSIIGGEVLLAGQALIGISIAARPSPTSLTLTGQAAGTILQPREGAATGELRLNAQAQAVSALKGHGIGEIPLPGNSSAISTTHLYAAGQLSLTRGLAAELQVTAKAGRTIAFSGTGDAKTLASTLAQSFGPELKGYSVAQSRGAAACLSIMALSSAGAARGAIATNGTARGNVELTRAFIGELNVHGDSTRQISLGGAASARTPSTSQTSKTVVELTGGSTARAATEAKSVASVALAGAAHADVVPAATTSGSFGWIIQASATAPQSAQSQGVLSLVGKGLARSAVDATARITGLSIGGELAGAAALTASLSADAALDGSAEGSFAVSGKGAGRFTVTRDSDAGAQVTGEAARTLPLAGAAAGTNVVQAERTEGAIALAGTATARVRAAANLARGAAMVVQGHATGAARIFAISSGRVAFVRLGQADVLVAAGAAHGMALLGSALAGNVTRATANLPLELRLSGAATNVIRVEFAAREVAVAARANAMLGVSGRAVARHLGLVAAVQALRAPPALRRSEPAKYGLNGRLMPTNSGRILRG